LYVSFNDVCHSSIDLSVCLVPLLDMSFLHECIKIQITFDSTHFKTKSILHNQFTQNQLLSPHHQTCIMILSHNKLNKITY